MTIVRAAVLQHILEARKKANAAYQARHQGEDRPVHLHVSDLGHCVRKAYLRMQGVEGKPFDEYIQEIMHAGLVWETETETALRAAYGDGLRTQGVVENEIWSGRKDFELPGNVIVEHKATSPVNFLRKDRLPYRFHCMQVLGYCLLTQLQEKMFIAPTARLYYRSWANWAELEVWEDTEGAILWKGEINGRSKCGGFPDSSIAGEMAFFETFWEPFWHDGSLPPRYATPFTEIFGCTRTTKQGYWPSCPFFGQCWPEMAFLKGPFHEKDWEHVTAATC